MIPVAAGARIWIASGHTDMRKGMNGLALLVQEGLGRDPFAGDVFVFRGRAGSLIKALWHDGIGLPWTVCLAGDGGWRGGAERRTDELSRMAKKLNL
jgi:transposase